MNCRGWSNAAKILVGSLLLLMVATTGSAPMAATGTESLVGWVTNTKAKSVSLVDLDTMTVIETFKVGKKPRGIDGTFGESAIVANYGSRSFSFVELEAQHVSHVRVAGRPTDVAMAPAGDSAVLALPATNTAGLVDETGLVSSIEVGTRPLAVAFSGDDGRQLATANSRSDSVSLLPFSDFDTAGRFARAQVIPVGREPRDLAFNAKGNTLVVSNFKSGTVSVIDVRTASVVDTLTAGKGPWGIDVTSSRPPVVVVANFKSNSVSLLEDGQRVDIRVGKRPIGVAISPDGRLALIANSRSKSVSVIDIRAATVIATIPVGKGPYGVSIGPNIAAPPDPDIKMLTPYVKERDIPRAEPFVSAAGMAASPIGREHSGLDFIIDTTGVPIRAVASGRVESVELAANDENWQVTVQILRDDGTWLIYGFEPFSSKRSVGQQQLDNILVAAGDEVVSGQALGDLVFGGTGAHLHFGLGNRAQSLCPEPFFIRKARKSITRLLRRTWGSENAICY